MDVRRPRLRKGCRMRAEERILLLPEGMMRLQGSGVAVLSLCDGQRTVAEIIERLREQFPAVGEEHLLAETQSFLDGLYVTTVLEFLQ